MATAAPAQKHRLLINAKNSKVWVDEEIIGTVQDYAPGGVIFDPDNGRRRMFVPYASIVYLEEVGP